MRILFLTTRPPWPVRRGDQGRTARFATALAGRHEVAVLAIRPPSFPPCPWPDEIAGSEVTVRWRAMLAGILTNPRLPLQVGLHQIPRFHDAVRAQVERFRPEAAIVVLSRIGGAIPALAGAPVVLDLVDSLRLNLANRARRQRLLGPALGWEARRIAAWDRRLMRSVDHTVVVSERDRRDLVGEDGALVRRTSVLPLAVPVAGGQPPEPPRPVVLLSGNLGYFPTADGARWFAREVWPRVRAQHPAAQWWLAGSRPPAALRRLAREPGVTLLLDPESLGDVVRQASVVVAPLLAGSGTPTKVLEAMAAGVAAVVTPGAAAGLDGLRGDEVAVASDAVEFAAAVSRLLADRAAARTQAAAAQDHVRRRHAVAVVAAQLEAILEHVARASD